MYTTLNKIQAHEPLLHPDGWDKLLIQLGKTTPDDEPLSILTILDSLGLEDALLCLRMVDDCDKEIMLYKVWCAKQVQHLMTDNRSVRALDVAEAFAHGKVTREQLSEALYFASDFEICIHAPGRAAAIAAAVDSGTAAGVAFAAACAACEGDAYLESSDIARRNQEAELRRICKLKDNLNVHHTK